MQTPLLQTLTAFRNKHHLRLIDMADQLDMPSSRLSAYENASKMITMDDGLKIHSFVKQMNPQDAMIINSEIALNRMFYERIDQNITLLRRALDDEYRVFQDAFDPYIVYIDNGQEHYEARTDSLITNQYIVTGYDSAKTKTVIKNILSGIELPENVN